MKIKNYDIYNYAIKITQEQERNNGEIEFDVPVIINFYIQKNIEEILKSAINIDKTRNFIIRKYRDNDNDNNGNNIKIKKEFVLEAQKDLDDLMNIEQDINITKIKLSELKNSKLTTKQLKMILFMIEDDFLNNNNDELKED